LLALVAAEAREFAGIRRRAEREVKLDWPVDFASTVWVNGKAMLLVANGPGPRLAATAVDVAREHQKLDGLVSTGFCGGLDPSLQLSDIFVATGVLDCAGAEASVVPLSGSSGRFQNGKLLSIDRVAWSAAEKSELRKTGAAAIEMEAAAVAEKAARHDLPFYCVRAISDTADENMPFDFNRMRDADGRFSRAKIIAAALRHPAKFGDLIKFDKKCKHAAEALGDFIASTRF